MEREYRAVKCHSCIWQDFYTMQQSYPPRCPECGTLCDHEFFVASFTLRQRALLGRDLGVRVAFGDPNAHYKNLAARARRRNYRGR